MRVDSDNHVVHTEYPPIAPARPHPQQEFDMELGKSRT